MTESFIFLSIPLILSFVFFVWTAMWPFGRLASKVSSLCYFGISSALCFLISLSEFVLAYYSILSKIVAWEIPWLAAVFFLASGWLMIVFTIKSRRK